MANPSTPSPATAPTEAPEIKSIQELQAKKADVLAHLQDIPDLTEPEKAKFAAEFEADIAELDTKTEVEKTRNLGSLQADLNKLKEDIHSEKKDADEELGTTTPASAPAEAKLGVEKEIRGRLDEFRASIDTKLAAPETASTPAPEPAETVPPETQDAINSAKEFFSNKGVRLDTAPAQQGNFFTNMFKKLILSWYGFLEGFGVDVRNARAKIEGYKNYESKQVVDETFKVLSSYVGDSLGEFTDVAAKEKLVDQIRGLGLPLVAGSNILAAPLMKVIFTGDESAWDNLPDDIDHDTLAAVRGKYLTLKDPPGTMSSMTTAEKLKEIFTIEEDKKKGYIERYEEDVAKREQENETDPGITPVPVPTETPETAPETVTPLKDVLSRYDGRAYDEQSETASKDTIFTFEKDDIFVSLKRGDQKETANINPDGTLTYRGIKGTPEMIIQLARLDMYMVSFKGSVELADNNNLTGENKIEKFYNDVDGQGVNNRIVTASVDEIPAFLQGWDWQKLELFLLRDSARQIAPAEAAEMSGEKPDSVTQEDLDIIMERTDTREDTEGAKFSGKVEEDGSITITRATSDGEKSWNDSIFPNADGTYMIGNVTFPNITDAIKAANMRNWVRGHESEDSELHEDGQYIQVDNGLFNDTNLIEDGKVPEFLTHGVLPDTGNALTDLSDVYDFLKGAVIEDGIYGKNKSRTKWESEQVSNTNNS